MSDLERDHKIFDQLDEVAILMKDEKWEEAEALLLEVYHSVPHPKEKDSMGNPLIGAIAAFYEKKGEPQKALPILLKEIEYLKTLEFTPSCSNFIVVGKIYYQLGQLEEARSLFKLAYAQGKNRVFRGKNTIFLKMARMDDKEFEQYKNDFDGSVLQVEKKALTTKDHDKISALCEEGNEAMDEGRFAEALQKFGAALAIVPTPNETAEYSGWLYASIGDAAFMLNQYEAALAAFNQAYKIYGVEAINPFVLLRLGQCHYEMGNKKQSIDFLLRAYMLEGEKIFEGERDYFDFLSQEVSLE